MARREPLTITIPVTERFVAAAKVAGMRLEALAFLSCEDFAESYRGEPIIVEADSPEIRRVFERLASPPSPSRGS